MSDDTQGGTPGNGPRRLRSLEAPTAEAVRPANDLGAPVYEPLPPAGKRSFAAATAISAAWLGLVAWYALSQVGLGAFEVMLPHELGAFFGGAAMPLLVLWFAVSYLARGRDLLRHSRALEVRLAELAYPAERAEAKLRTIGDSLREQALALADASDQATRRLMEARQGLSSQAGELTTVSDQAAMRAMQVMAGFRRHADGLERVTALLTSRVQIV
jgi:hypothetical protein